jgi:hypothetical protein
MVGVLLVTGVSQRPVQLAQHDVGEADHGIERRAQLMAHLRHQLADAAGRGGLGRLRGLLGAVAAGEDQHGRCRPGRHQEGQVPGRKARNRIGGCMGRSMPGGCQSYAEAGEIEDGDRPRHLRPVELATAVPRAHLHPVHEPGHPRPAHGRSPPWPME